jgi:hypothetical protein|tara:strand:- start:11612 stop:12682 length:1071 start_codon:yes stop_codon:yes gene_type:complete
MSDTAISTDTGEVAPQEDAVVNSAFEAQEVGVVSAKEAAEYLEDNETLVPDEEAPKEGGDPEPEKIGDQVEAEPEAVEEPEEAEAEAEAAEDEDAETDPADQEPENVEFVFGGKKLEVARGDMTDELAEKVTQFTDEVWADYTTKSQANAEMTKTLSAKTESVEKLMTLNGEALQTYSQGLALRQDIEMLQSVDMNALRQHDPDQWRYNTDLLAQKQADFQNIVALVDQQETQLNDAKQIMSEQRGIENRKTLNNKIKDFETKVAPQVVDYVMETYGWAQDVAERWDQNPDMTDMARKAMLYDKMQAKTKSASKQPAPKKADPVAAAKNKGKAAATTDPTKMSLDQLAKHLKLPPR